MPTLATIRARVQVKINDTDSPKGTFDVVSTDHAIADSCLALASKIPPPHLYLPSSFIIAAGADTFTLPTAAQVGYASLTQYAGDVRIRLVNWNSYLNKRSVEEMDATRERESSTYQDIPRDFCLWEEMDNDMQGRCHPRSKAAEPCDLFVSLVPDDLRDAADMDAANVRFSRYGAAALVFHASAMLVAAMSADEVKTRNLNPNAASLWMKQSDTLLYQEAVRRNNTEDAGRTQRWVS